LHSESNKDFTSRKFLLHKEVRHEFVPLCLLFSVPGAGKGGSSDSCQPNACIREDPKQSKAASKSINKNISLPTGSRQTWHDQTATAETEGNNVSMPLDHKKLLMYFRHLISVCMGQVV
jgi:hypothetical protein